MLRRTLAAAAALLAIAAGCYNNAALTNALAPARTAPIPTCEASSCAEMWQRAQLWVVNHSKWKIQTATDVVIETFNPVGYDASYGFTITKEPQGSGKYDIMMKASCGNAFGCNPKMNDVWNAFNYYVGTGRDVLSGVGNLSGIR